MAVAVAMATLLATKPIIFWNVPFDERAPSSHLRFLSPNSTLGNQALFFSYKLGSSQALLRASSSSSSSSVNEAITDQKVSTLREICEGYVPEYVMRRAEDVGYLVPTEVQKQALPVLFSGRDCILHAQTGSGKTLTYLLLIYSVISIQRSAVQALIVVPTRELGMQVTKVARKLAANPVDCESEKKSYVVMALLDGGLLKRHKTWLKAEPPAIVVATLGSLCQMLDKEILNLDSLRVMVIDEVDFMFNSSKQVSSLRKLLTSFSSFDNHQTVFASASIPQHRHFLRDCVQQKWTKSNVIHVHCNPINPMPSCLHHRLVICNKGEKYQTFLSLIQCDAPNSGIIFVGEQSERSKKAGNSPTSALLLNFLKSSYKGSSEILVLEEEINYNERAASLSKLRQGVGYLLVATDILARGVDLPETTHIYNFDLPRTATDYLHRAGRTGRKPFSDQKCMVTNIITSAELFVLQRYENELKFTSEELII